LIIKKALQSSKAQSHQMEL